VKILLTHGDGLPWATYNRCIELQKRWTTDIVDVKRCADTIDYDYYDVIHPMFSGGLSLYYKDIAKKYKDKFYSCVASFRTLEGVHDDVGILKNIYKHSKKIVVQNKQLKDGLIKLIGEREGIVYIPNGVDENKFKKDIVVGYVGCKNENDRIHKGYYLVKQACKELGVTFKRAVNDYPVSITKHEDMPSFYSSISCLVIPSKSEGCNNPILEALAMNVPVVATNTGIVPELNVSIVTREIESIKTGIKKAVPRFEILEKYTWDIVAKQYRDLYELEPQ